MAHFDLIPSLCGLAVLVCLWVAYALASGSKFQLSALYQGADGRPSTSKFQWLLWTTVAIFAYVAVVVSRARLGNYEAMDELPRSLLIAMGFSSTTMVVAKGITTAYVASGRVDKGSSQPAPPSPPPAAAAPAEAPDPAAGAGAGGPARKALPGGIFAGDDGRPDLSKVQLMAWTLIGIGVYLTRLFHTLGQANPSSTLPDIDGALMVLMGLGQGAYLGKKLVTADTPRLTSLSPYQGAAGTAVKLAGTGFGATQSGSVITINGVPAYPVVTSWSDTLIEFALPSNQLNGTKWAPGQQLLIGLVVGGQVGANQLEFQISTTLTP